MKYKFIQILTIVILCTISNGSFSNYNNESSLKRVEFSKIKKIQIFILSSNNAYPIRGNLNDQVDALKKHAGINIVIGSIYQIVQFEHKLKLEKFKTVNNYNEFINDFGAYVLIIINTELGTTEIAYNGKYLLDITHKRYKKYKGKPLLSFE